MVPTRTKSTPIRRAGFTLIELMIVITIIAILIGLLVPAVQRAIRTTKIGGVRNEISQLETAIGKFKADHGIEPPSSITLYESATGWNSDATSKAAIRQIWPQFNFALVRELDGNTANTNGSVALTPAECMVFFLGGKPTIPGTNGSTVFAMTGFAKDPSDPFAATGSREAPLFEFRTDRLTDVDNDNAPEYRDGLSALKTPYLYYSSYDGQGYNNSEFIGNGSTAAIITYGLYSPYRQGLGASDPFWKTNSCQIISPGYDGKYGVGGAYIAAGTDHLPTTSTPSALIGLRAYEADNITNFSLGELSP